MIARIFVSTWYWVAAAIVVGATAIFFAPALLSHTATPGESDNSGVANRTKVIVAPEEAAAKTAAGLAGAPQAAMRAESTIANAAFSSAVHSAPRRQLARSASISLIVGNVDRALAAMTFAARSSGGDVVKLDDERPAAPGERHTAQATLSVPERSFDATLKRLGALGGVRSQSIAAEDVSDQIVDATARLRNLRRTEVDLLGIMDRSGRISEVLDVQNQLSDVRDRIERLDAETHALSARVTFATIEVSLEDEAPVAVAEPSSRSLLGAAWGNAWHASRDAAIALVGRSFMILAFAPYWLALLALGLLLATQARRRFGNRVSAKG